MDFKSAQYYLKGHNNITVDVTGFKNVFYLNILIFSVYNSMGTQENVLVIIAPFMKICYFVWNERVYYY